MSRIMSVASLLAVLGLVASAAPGGPATTAPKPKPAGGMDAVKDCIAKTEFKVEKPAKARKVLLYDHCNGFNHGGGRDAARVAFPLLAEKTKAFEVVISNDLANFEADKLKEFDAVMFSNTTGELFTGKAFDQCEKKPANQDEAKALSEKYRANLVNFVKNGGGLWGNHAATDCSYSWKEWGEMMGGYFGGHPYSQIHVKIDDPGNPLIAVTNDKDFDIRDEIYIFADKGAKNVYSRDKVRVILSIDVPASKITKQAREDQDYALMWVKSYGSGRVYYCVFGHDQKMFAMPNVLQFYVASLQFACGDLKVDTTPKPLPATKPAEK
jgi:type 1 glutamine amidotransferase